MKSLAAVHEAKETLHAPPDAESDWRDRLIRQARRHHRWPSFWQIFLSLVLWAAESLASRSRARAHANAICCCTPEPPTFVGGTGEVGARVAGVLDVDLGVLPRAPVAAPVDVVLGAVGLALAAVEVVVAGVVVGCAAVAGAGVAAAVVPAVLAVVGAAAV